ncbi:hypothetical protein CNR22_16810 [Sphingobacteriaceae bacterium]|nr:hypothetical protein CNR22_16810 [Sphingobacteriaceae bacterium]
MRTLKWALPSLFLFFLITSCKKGEDDPAFTLLSRKARVAGEWKLAEGNITLGVKDASGIYAVHIYKLKDNGYTRKDPGRGASFEGDYNLSLIFTKDGKFSMTQLLDSLNFAFKGSWQFEGKSSSAKNKERINLQLDKGNNSSGYYAAFNKSLTNFKYRIKELRNKKMVLTCTEEMLDLNSTYGLYVTAEYTFVQ